jgi:uncharacterized protein (TIGR02996 family)
VTEREAFIADIAATPADDLPRLVFAEWLDDQETEADAARAEFIRIQIELAKGVPCRWMGTPVRCEIYSPRQACDGCRRRQDLRRRERELFDAHCGDWFDWPPNTLLALQPPTAPAEPGMPCLVVRRGFVDAVHLPSAAWLGGECERCGGSGDGHVFPHPQHMGCIFCHGTGRTAGLGGRLARGHPLTAVTLTDKEPEQDHGWYTWHADGGRAASSSHLIYAAWLLVAQHYQGRVNGVYARFTTRESALAALSAALLWHAKSRPAAVSA